MVNSYQGAETLGTKQLYLIQVQNSLNNSFGPPFHGIPTIPNYIKIGGWGSICLSILYLQETWWEMDPIFRAEAAGHYFKSYRVETATSEYECCLGYLFTLQGTNISPKNGMFEDDFPFPQVGYVNFLEGNVFFLADLTIRCLDFFDDLSLSVFFLIFDEDAHFSQLFSK